MAKTKAAALPERAEWDVPYQHNLLKELVLTYMAHDPEEDEAKSAEESAYGMWWKFLKESPDYPPHEGASQDVKDLYKDFGELGTSFAEWWRQRGRQVFQEQEMVPVIKILRLDRIDFEEFPKSITLEVPLTISASLIRDQLNMILAKYHPGSNLLRHRHSTARRPLFPKRIYSTRHLTKLLDVWRLREKSVPQLEFWEIGHKARVSPIHDVLETDPPATKTNKRKVLGKKTWELFVQARRMMHHAAHGSFPCDNSYAGEPRPKKIG